MKLTLKTIVAGILLITSLEVRAQDEVETRTPVDKLYQAFVRDSDIPAELRVEKEKVCFSDGCPGSSLIL